MSGVIAYNTLISSLILGIIYSLIAIGYVVVFRASRVFNFAHPQFMFMGALFFTTFYKGGGWVKFLLAVLASVLIIGAIGAIVYFLVVHRTLGRPHWIQMVLTMGLGIVGLNVAQWVWGTNTRFAKFPLRDHTWQLPGGARLGRTDLIIAVVGIVLYLFLYWLLTVSPMGVRLRAIAENPTLSAYSGIRLGQWFSIAWAIAAAVAVIAGIGYALRTPVDPSLTDVGLLAFPAAMIGGMDSIKGCLFGGVILALVQQYSAQLWNANTSVALGFGVVLVVLVVRPRGLFGAPVADRV